MKAQVIQSNLTPSNCVAILVDFQTRLLSTINSIDSKTLIENAFDLAGMASSLGIPTTLTTIGAKSFGGPLLPQFQMISSNREPIDCSTMSVCLKNRFQIVADWLITLFFKRDSSKLT